MEITPGFIELQKAAEIIAERLGSSILRYKVEETGELLESLDWKVVQNQIHILYNYYGMFPDMGVGKGVSYGQTAESKRKKKPWYNKTIHREIMRLTELSAKKAGVRAVDVVANITERNQFAAGSGTKQIFDTISLHI
jgi:hypothetical protein